MDAFEEITKKLLQFRDERDWEQFHDSKNLASAISIEAAELQELFLWKSSEESQQVDTQRVSEEISDVLAYTFLLAESFQIDIKKAVLDKIEANALKYPISKSKGIATKYDQL